MSDNQLNTSNAKEGNSSVAFKLQISKEKVEKMQFEKSFENMGHIIHITQKNMNLKRTILVFSVYIFSLIITNLLIFQFFHFSPASPYLYTLSNIAITLCLLPLLKRNAPINESDIKKTLEKIQKNP